MAINISVDYASESRVNVMRVNANENVGCI